MNRTELTREQQRSSQTSKSRPAPRAPESELQQFRKLLDRFFADLGI